MNDNSHIILDDINTTYKYAPPEFLSGTNVAVYGNSDIWSLGTILYEIYYEEPYWRNNKEVNIEVNIQKSVNKLKIVRNAIRMLVRSFEDA